MREGFLLAGPRASRPTHLLPFFFFFCFLPVTYLSGAARSHYGGVRKAVGRVASPCARVTDCCSASVGGGGEECVKVIASVGQEVGTKGC